MNVTLFIKIDYDSLNWEGDKVYFSSDRLMISETVLCVLVPALDGLEIAIPVSQLNVDNAGIYVFAEQIGKIITKCRNGHLIRHDCGGGCVMWCLQDVDVLGKQESIA